MFADGIGVDGGDFAHVGLGLVWVNNFISLQNPSNFLFITHFACFMIHRSIELLPNRQKNKDTLWNLSQLLGPNVVATPQKIINQKMFLVSHNRLIKTPDLSAKKQTLPRHSTKSATRINFQHYRIKSSLKLKGQFLSSKDAFVFQRHNSQPILKGSLKNTINPLKFTKQRSQEIFSFEKSFKSQQLKAGSTIIKKRKLPQYDENPVDPEAENYENYLAKSLQIRKPIQQNLRQSSLSQQISLKSQNKRTFLRKGSSLQKQIVVNLLKNKLIKQHEFDIEKQYTMSDIVKMIKLYKGVHNQQLRNPQLIFSDRKNQAKSSDLLNRVRRKNDNSCPINVVKKFQRSIEGWEIQQELEAQFIKKEEEPRQNHILIDIEPHQNARE